MLQYLWSSKNFFKKVITIVKLAPTLQCHAQAIEKLNHYIYIWFISLCPTVVANRQRQNTYQDWELLAKNYKEISHRFVNDPKLLRLNLYILALGYLKERAIYFIKLLTKKKNGEKNGGNQELQVSDLEEEKKNKRRY